MAEGNEKCRKIFRIGPKTHTHHSNSIYYDANKNECIIFFFCSLFFVAFNFRVVKLLFSHFYDFFIMGFASDFHNKHTRAHTHRIHSHTQKKKEACIVRRYCCSTETVIVINIFKLIVVITIAIIFCDCWMYAMPIQKKGLSSPHTEAKRVHTRQTKRKWEWNGKDTFSAKMV